jgi:hypothetical protein
MVALYASHNQEALRGLEIQQRAMTDVLIAIQRVSMLIVWLNELIVVKNHGCRRVSLTTNPTVRSQQF